MGLCYVLHVLFVAFLELLRLLDKVFNTYEFKWPGGRGQLV